MGLFPGLLFGAAPAPPSADLGDANIWELTSIVDVPTGVAVGDYGVLADRVYKRATLTVDAGAGGGTLDLWVPPDVAAWTSPTVYAYLDGDEDAVARGNQGWTDSITGFASITGDVSGSGYTRLEATINGSVAAIQTLASSLAAGTRVYIRGECAGQSEADAFVGWFIADGTNILRFYDEDSELAFRDNSNTTVVPSQIRSGGAALSGTAALLETVDEGRTVYATAYRDGAAYHATQRSTGTSAANRVEFRAFRGPGVTRAPQLDVRRLIVVAGT